MTNVLFQAECNCSGLDCNRIVIVLAPVEKLFRIRIKDDKVDQALTVLISPEQMRELINNVQSQLPYQESKRADLP